MHRAKALERLGHKVIIVDPLDGFSRSKLVSRWLYHAGAIGIGFRINKPIAEAVAAFRPALIFVNQGEFLGPRLLRCLRLLDVPIINYTNDNPFIRRGGMRFHYYRRALRYYDLLAIVREESVARAKAFGCRHVMRVWMTADEEAHQLSPLPDDIRDRYSSDVLFVGSWMPERGPFMAELISRGVPLAIWGDGWQKAEEWPLIKPCWRGPGIYDNEGYAAAIQSAAICLGLLSKGNRDLHTRRSIEIPTLGGLLCAERTPEHLALYTEGREAVFWNDAEECAAACERLLGDESLRQMIARSGRKRALRNGHLNEPMLAAVIDNALASFGTLA